MHGTCRRLLAAMLVLGCVGRAMAGGPEVPRFRVLGVRDGLPSSTVTGLAHDRAGFLWIATADGLARYDGLGFQVWRHEPGRADSLPGNTLTAVHVDARDRIWAAVEGQGLVVLDADRRHLRRYARATDPAVGSDDVWAVTGCGGDVWFGTLSGGLHRIDARGRVQRFMPVPGDARSLPADTVPALECDPRGRLWVGTRDGLARWTGRDFERLPLPGEDPEAIVFSMRWLDGALWVGTDNGLFRLDGARWSTPAWSAMFGRPNVLLDAAPDGDGGYWLATQRSLWHLDAGDVPHPVSVPEHTRPEPVFQLLRQPGGATWFPMPGVGLAYLPSDWRRLAEYSAAQGLSTSTYVATTTDASGTWLLGRRGELDRMDGEGVVHPMPGPWSREPAQDALVGAAVDRHGARWFGGMHVLMRLDRDGVLRQWRLDDEVDAALGGSNRYLRVAPDDTLWIASVGNGLQQRDTATGRVLRGFAPGLGMPDASVVFDAMEIGPGSAPWIATAGQLLRWDARSAALRAVPGIAPGARIFAFAFDRDGGVWLHRLSGLEHYRRDVDRWTPDRHASLGEGMPAVESSGLVVDAGGRVWLSTLRGLYRWDPLQRRLRHFGVDDGLASQEIVAGSMTLADGHLLVAALADGGILRLDTAAGERAAPPAPLLFDRIETRRDGRWLALDPRRLRLAPDERELRVQLRLLSYSDARNNVYATRLDGYDSDWVTHTGGDPGERVFAALPPGRYTLHARARDAATGERVERRLRFTVLPPWWRTPSALAGFAGALLLLLAAAVLGLRRQARRRERLRLAEHERALAHEASLAKTRFLATLGHEIRTPMTGVLGMSELLLDTGLDARQRGYTESIRSAGEHLLRLVNDALDLARIEAGRIELAEAPFDLHALLEEIARLTGPLAGRKGLSFTLQVGDGLPAAVLGDADRVRQILLNLLGNAVKFTEAGRVWLRADVHACGVMLEVGDTGPGLDAAQRARLFRRFEQAGRARTAFRHGGSGLGLAICRELATAMGGRIDLESTPGVGSRFIVELPLPAVAPARPQAPPGIEADLPPLHLLLVEDDPAVAQVLSGLLEAQGHRVVHAPHGLAALVETARGRFDLALLDLDLPGMDGFALARALRAKGVAAPLLAITARADAEAETRAQDAGFDGFLRKPVTGALLAAALGRVFAGVA